MLAITQPRAAYIHVPFCAHRCGYCNFTLVAGRDDLIEQYLLALERELTGLEIPRPVETLFFGGGTPTHLRGAHLERLLQTVLKWHPLEAGNEFSVEANPADLDEEAVAILAAHGVTRVSLGAQSFNEAKLKILERDHVAADIGRSVELIRSVNLDVSLDLIFAAPGETTEVWNEDLRQALELRPGHVSTYGLTFERGTQFWNRLEHGLYQRADEELERQFYETAIEQLADAGLEHYEVSNFAMPGKRCRHNEAYWTGKEYFAAGPGAARYIDGERSINHRSTTTYIKRVLAGESPVAESEVLSPNAKARELFVFAMRRLEGVQRDWFAAQSDFALDELLGEMIRRHLSLGLLADDGERVRLTHAGLLVSDALWGEYLSE